LILIAESLLFYLDLGEGAAHNFGIFIQDQFGELIKQWQAQGYRKLSQKEILDSLK